MTPRLPLIKGTPFRRFLLGYVVSSFGDAILPMAIIVAIVVHGGSASGVAYVVGSGVVGRLLTVLPGGALADRCNRRKLMILTEFPRAVIQGGVALALMCQNHSIILLLVANFAHGLLGGIYNPCARTTVPILVHPCELQKAIGLQAATSNIIKVIAPALAGVISAVFGAAPLFGVDALTFLINGFVVVSLPVARFVSMGHESVSEVPRVPLRGQIVIGFEEIRSRAWLSLNLLSHTAWNFGIVAFLVVGPVETLARYGSAVHWGLVTSFMGGGGVIGAICAMYWRPRTPLRVANFLMTLSALPLLALAWRLPVTLVCASALLCDFCVCLAGSYWEVSIQSAIPQDVRARVSSVDYLASVVTTPISYGVIGLASSSWGASTVLLGGAVLVSLPSLLLCFVSRSFQIRQSTGG